MTGLLKIDTPELRKERGAFFTPQPIADFLAAWAVGGRPNARVLDPTCGEAAFLQASGHELAKLGVSTDAMEAQLFGVDLHSDSLAESDLLMREQGIAATLVEGDFFEEETPNQLNSRLPFMDAVVGNPPFVRYHVHRGETRRRSVAAALEQGVRLSGLASSWAALLVHSTGFLRPDGRVAMVLPAELLTVGYAEPIRRWLRKRFASVHLVMFENLQFSDAEEQVVLLVARGSGGCDAFALHQVDDASDLYGLHAFDGTAVAPPEGGKWTDLLMSSERRALFNGTVESTMVQLSEYGRPELGTVTGANAFFALNDATRSEFNISLDDLSPIVPPGTKHVRGTRFTKGHWEQLRLEGKRVWLLDPRERTPRGGLAKYIKRGELEGLNQGYKCSLRSPWWRPPTVAVPDLFFTYMSHRFPRLVANDADVTFVNSMHGLKFRDGAPRIAKQALPLLMLNSATLLGAELCGRSYGGGILKMEPSEAAVLPVPAPEILEKAWSQLVGQKMRLEELVRSGNWIDAVALIDEAVLVSAAGLSLDSVQELRSAASALRGRRTRATRAAVST